MQLSRINADCVFLPAALLIMEVKSQPCDAFTPAISTNHYNNYPGHNVTLYCAYPDAETAFSVTWYRILKCEDRYDDLYYADPVNPNESKSASGYEKQFHGEFVNSLNHSLTAINFMSDGSRFYCLVRTIQAANGSRPCVNGKFSGTVLVILESKYKNVC